MNTPANQARAIFVEAIEQLDAGARAKFIALACGGDAELQQRVERLVRSHQQLGSFHDQPPSPAATLDQPASERIGTQIGPYKLLQQIGEGGMGVVYMAEQTEPIARRVALKIIKLGMDSRQVIARFEAERHALALMDHVNIARVLDAGTTGEGARSQEPGTNSPSVIGPRPLASSAGRPYFVMELVHGVPITKYCDDNQLTPRQRLELFVPVCQAIQHAHQKGIIHRDIKPSNVMVTLYDGKPVPKVIDFGVAKATEQKLTERTLFTQFGTMVGTLEYMSPEQAEMSALGVDTRSDIYSLGVLLYELLTGSTPLSHKRLKEAAFGEILRMIKEEEPQKPSTRLSDSGEALASISAQRQTEPAKLTRLMRGELDWIVMKTLEKDRKRRYATVNDFAADVERYLKDEPVEACPPSALYRFRKFARRHKRGLLTAAVVALAVVLTAASSGGIIWRANQDLHQALDRERDTLDRERRGAYFQRVALAEREWAANNLSRMEELLGQCPEDLRGWEWHYLRRLLHGQPPLVLHHEATVLGVAVSPNSRQIAAGSQDGFITLWDAATGQRLHAFRGHEQNVSQVAFSPDGRRLASGSGDGTAKIWDLGRLPGRDRASDPVVIQIAAAGVPATSVAFSPDGGRLATAVNEVGGRVKVWDAATGRELLSLGSLEQGAASVAFSADGRILAAGGDREAVKLWDARTGEELHSFSGFRTNNLHVTFSPDGGLVASGGRRDGQRMYEGVKVWDARTGQERFTLVGHVNGIFDVVFSPEGRLATAGFDETVKVWDAATGLEVLTLRGHECSVRGVAFSPDGNLLVSAGFDRTVRIWDGRPLRPGEPGQEYRTLGGHPDQEGISGVAFHADGRRLAARDGNGIVKLWDWRAGKELHTLRTTEREKGLALSPDGKWLATVGQDLDTTDREENRKGGRRREWIVKLWAVDPNPAGGLIPPEHALRGHTKPLLSVAFSPDGRYLASSTATGKPEVGVWDVATLQPLHRQPLRGGNNWPIWGIAINGDALLAAASLDGTVRIWDVRAGQELVDPPLKHAGPVWAVAFSPDGRLLASVGGDRVVKVWEKIDAKTWNLRHTLHDPGAVMSVAFSPDGRRLAWGGTDCAVKVWDLPAEPGGSVNLDFHALRGHRSWVRGVAFSPDGQYLASGSQDGTVKIWETPRSQPATEESH